MAGRYACCHKQTKNLGNPKLLKAIGYAINVAGQQ